jgi:hypothetical protein
MSKIPQPDSACGRAESGTQDAEEVIKKEKKD